MGLVYVDWILGEDKKFVYTKHVKKLPSFSSGIFGQS